jgi:hypothetical protein
MHSGTRRGCLHGNPARTTGQAIHGRVQTAFAGPLFHYFPESGRPVISKATSPKSRAAPQLFGNKPLNS